MGIPIGHGRPLSPFGQFVQKELEAKDINLTDFARSLGTPAGTISRYLRNRRPPDKLVAKMARELGLDEEGEKKMRDLLNASEPSESRPPPPLMRQMARRTIRTFGEFTVRRMAEQLPRLGWSRSFCEASDDFSYDLKVYHPDSPEVFVLLNFLGIRNEDPVTLKRFVKGQAGIEDGVTAIAFFEPFAGSIRLPEEMAADLFQPEAVHSVDAWLRRETDGLGRLVHGGNMIAVLAEYLQVTDEVSRYLDPSVG